MKWHKTSEINPPANREFLAKWVNDDEIYRGSFSSLPGVFSNVNNNPCFVGYKVNNPKHQICNGFMPEYWAEIENLPEFNNDT